MTNVHALFEMHDRGDPIAAHLTVLEPFLMHCMVGMKPGLVTAALLLEACRMTRNGALAETDLKTTCRFTYAIDRLVQESLEAAGKDSLPGSGHCFSASLSDFSHVSFSCMYVDYVPARGSAPHVTLLSTRIRTELDRLLYDLFGNTIPHPISLFECSPTTSTQEVTSAWACSCSQSHYVVCRFSGS